MKKIFLILTALVVIVIGGAYGLLFTSGGNSYVASIIEDKVNEGQDDVNLKVDSFKLTTSDILFKATIDDNSTINIEGKLAILSKSIDLKYDVNIKDLSKLKNITKQQLNGSFVTKGTVKGNEELAFVKGDSQVASSDTTYDIKLVNFNPSNILFNMKNAKIEELLYLGNQPLYANGLLNINADIKSADVNNLDGNVLTTISNGVLNAKVLNKELKQNPKTPITFTTNVVSKLASTSIDSKVNFDSNVASLDTKHANVNLANGVISSDYKLFVKNLSLLEQIINQKFNGTFTTSGKVNMSAGEIAVNGITDIFKSDSNYTLKIKDSKPQAVNVNIKNAQIQNLLELVNQPKYANGLLNIDMDIKNADVNNLEGVILTKISKGLVNNKVVNKAFEQKLKAPLNFTGDIKTKLESTEAISNVKVNTTMANLAMKELVYDIAKLSLNSDYTLDVKDLSKLYDVIAKKMKGALILNGTIKQDAQNLKVDGVSSLLGGTFNFDLNNDDFKAKIKDIEVKQALEMMYYPVVFDSKSDLTMDYNLATKQGQVVGGLINGRFLNNKYSNIINTFAKFDLTKEVYENVSLNSKINKSEINTFIDMQSKYTQIKVPSSTLNTEKNSINALVQTTIKKISFDTTVKGSLTSPKVKVDTKAFLKSKYGAKINEKKKKLEKKIEEKLQKKLGDKFKLDQLFNKAPEANENPSNEEIARAFKSFFGK